MVYNLFWTILCSSIFIVPQAFLLLLHKLNIFSNFLESKDKIWKKGYWLLAGVLIVLGLIVFLGEAISDATLGNFILHFVGGGVVVSLIFEYFKSNLKTSIPILLQPITLYILVSSLGVANELLEFTLDILFNKPFNSDRFDTWRDLTANTLGAFLGWLLWSLFRWIWQSFQNKKSGI